MLGRDLFKPHHCPPAAVCPRAHHLTSLGLTFSSMKRGHNSTYFLGLLTMRRNAGRRVLSTAPTSQCVLSDGPPLPLLLPVPILVTTTSCILLHGVRLEIPRLASCRSLASCQSLASCRSLSLQFNKRLCSQSTPLPLYAPAPSGSAENGALPRSLFPDLSERHAKAGRTRGPWAWWDGQAAARAGGTGPPG